jgi:hypothetical protein
VTSPGELTPPNGRDLVRQALIELWDAPPIAGS